MIFLYIGLGLLVLYIVFCAASTHIAYKTHFYHRGDGNLHVIYSYTYPDLEREKISFKNSKGATLYGFIYRKKGYNKSYKSILIIQHGLGGGHAYLMPTIQYFASRGYLVIGYDQYACCTSEGKNMIGLCQGVLDLKSLYCYIKNREDLANYKIDIFGHSWGGYAAGSILCDRDVELNHVFIASGFNNEPSTFVGSSRFTYSFLWMVYLRNFLRFGKVAFYSIEKGVKKNRNSRIFYIQGSHDNVIKPKYAGYKFEKLANKYKNLDVLMVENKGHAPYVSRKSQKAQDELIAQLGITVAGHVPYDKVFYYDDCSEIDDNIYSQILSFYEK